MTGKTIAGLYQGQRLAFSAAATFDTAKVSVVSLEMLFV